MAAVLAARFARFARFALVALVAGAAGVAREAAAGERPAGEVAVVVHSAQVPERRSAIETAGPFPHRPT